MSDSHHEVGASMLASEEIAAVLCEFGNKPSTGGNRDPSN
jgi:hypothetical protein